ncbi:MAG: hypothetical protein LBS54_04115 [Dysgonamonadaceae bacterium]|jgi:hypothetical protein|nr:hypothetical protein [Dysgonamonadaceae bacterium]
MNSQYTIGAITFGFSAESIRQRYKVSDKEAFTREILTDNPGVDEKPLKKTIDKVWREAFPKQDANEEEGAE